MTYEIKLTDPSPLQIIKTLDAEIKRLRDALKTCRELLRAALKTDREFRECARNAVIEECARVAETADCWAGCSKKIPAAIRALKDKKP